ncbi:hypothetical protein [Burkholderia pseudomallei]|uniref:hypothetical protein n=1 Tax=Burkholderia pseudomallei TaxID=28450 RepID=UPI000978D5E4|nr:hypothetical protein [Burkholderia pseudomallei]OMZ34313.1 hypothetical protein AQ861_13965 [Burkholderia pseudomallei]
MMPDTALPDTPDTPARTFPAAAHADAADAADLPTLAAQPVRERLAAFGAPPAALDALLRAGATRLLDSDMIIAQPRAHAAARDAERATTPLRYEQSAQTEAVLEQIAHEGLAPHFKPFMRGFSHVMSALFLTPEQDAKVQAYRAAGHHLRFLMSDGGGPALAGWRSTVRVEHGRTRLAIDKVWGIEAHRESIGLVAVRAPGAFMPAAYLVWPEQYRTLERAACGEPFLEGGLQLGNVRGEIETTPEDRLRIGGPNVFNKYLTIVRPYFVRALMAHVGWLAREGRLALSPAHESVRRFVADAARAQSRSSVYGADVVQRVLALKFAANELLGDLVRGGAVRRFDDQRDLLALSKMEGSAYRCYYEIRMGTKRA